MRKLRFDGGEFGEALEQLTKNPRSLAVVDNLFVLSKRRCAPPVKVVLDAIDLQASARVRTHGVNFFPGKRMTVDVVVLANVIDGHDIRTRFIDATQPPQPSLPDDFAGFLVREILRHRMTKRQRTCQVRSMT